MYVSALRTVLKENWKSAYDMIERQSQHFECFKCDLRAPHKNYLVASSIT